MLQIEIEHPPEQLRRSQGMGRACAALTSAAVLGPSALLRTADAVGARAGPVPIVGHGAVGAQGCGPHAALQPDRPLAELDALMARRVFTEHGVDAGPAAVRVRAACLAVADVFAGNVLQSGGHVLEDMAEPGQRAVVGSVTAATGVMRLAGKPDFCACSRIGASLGAF